MKQLNSYTTVSIIFKKYNIFKCYYFKLWEGKKIIIISSNFFKILLIYYADFFLKKSNIILFFPWYGRLAGNYRQVIGLSVVLLSEVDKNLV